MEDDRLKNLKIVAIAALVIGFLAALAYVLYGFSLLWATFAAGITIGILLIIMLVLIVLAIYLWIRFLLIKRELKKYESRLEQAKMELIRCKSELNRKNIPESDIED